MKRALLFFAALLLVAGGIVAVAISKSDDDKVTLPGPEVDTFLHAWSRNDPADMATLIDTPPADFAAQASSLVQAVPGSTATYTRTALGGTKTEATATYHAKVTLPGLGAIEWNASLALVHSKAGWRITWAPGILYPGLAQGQRFATKLTWAPRASIIGGDGSVLAGNQKSVDIGIEPRRMKSPADLVAIKFAMKATLGVDAATIDKALNAPGVRPDFFVGPFATIPKDARYTTIRGVLYPIPGVVFHDAKGVSSIGGTLASQILGNVGPITAEQLKKLGPPYKAGDQVGLSGLQQVYEQRLAGTPRTDVIVVDAKGAPVRSIKRFPGTAPKTVKLTIDFAVQKAAEAALASVTQNAALVALDTTTGAIRAVVSKPDNGFNRAISGRYPPGSTFKVITSTALLTAGDNPATPAPCPGSITVDGATFHNFEKEASTSLNLAQAFAMSCNNAFIGLADQLPPDAMATAAASFGFNTHWSLGIDTAGGSYPTPEDRAELAASAIGQGRVLASPLQMASVAAAVASGQWRAPTLITDPAIAPGPKVAALSTSVVATLRQFMASVVRAGGTAAGAGLPLDSFGKTGTAEFGNEKPAQTHAWFIGYRGTLAYAVIVEDGGVGGQVAAPLAAGFLTRLPK